MGKKRFRESRKKQDSAVPVAVQAEPEVVHKKTVHTNRFFEIYDVHYRKLLFIPIVLLLLAFAQIGYQIASTGSFINKGVTLRGGTTITIPVDKEFNTDDIKQFLNSMAVESEVKILRSAGSPNAIVVETTLTERADIDAVEASLAEKTGIPAEMFRVDTMGASLGESFFKEIMIAMVVAFIFMSIVVFLYFRTLVPSAAVILAAFSDIVMTLAVVNLLGIKVSSAGIAAFLMLIGYSVDTDILLTTRLLKRKEGTVFERTIDAAKTGITMTMTTLAAATAIMIFSTSEIITQIATIIFIGIIFDNVNTWIQNVGILRIYMEKHGKV
jgi:preprotein translocase subunit SecF